MKTLIIVSSTYLGNTMKVASAMAGELGAKVVTPREATAETVAGYDLIGLGSGVRFSSHDRETVDVARRILPHGKPVFIFSTRCNPLLGGYHSRLKGVLGDAGATLLGEWSCRGLDQTGPWVMMNGFNKSHPTERDLARARIFAGNVRKEYLALRNRTGSGSEANVYLNAATCIACGKCVKSCPVKVFEMNGKVVAPTGARHCLMCGTCERSCPADSISVKNSVNQGFRTLFGESKLGKIYWGNR